MKGECPICGAEIDLPKDTQISEIINCPECQGRILVKKIEGEKVFLEKAPEVEEDWGE